VALWTRLLDYTERIDGELRRREAAPAGVPLILAWSGTVSVPAAGEFGAGFVAGPTDRWTDTVCRGDSAGIQVDLTWPGARAVLGMPLVELRNRAVTVEDVWGAAGRRLVERLAETPAPAERRLLVESFIRRRAEHPVPPMVAAAAALVDRHAGRIGVVRLADELGCGRQHVHREVTRHLGLPPRTLARLTRFRSVLRAVRTGRDRAGKRAETWAGLAADFGYYDQAHLYREFRDLAGMTPKQARATWRPPADATSVHDGPDDRS
jgi:AraC-like DNA-binding protein